MRREQGVIVTDRRAQKRWPPAGDGKLEARQHARVVREQTVIASLNIAEGIRKQESVRVLQRESRQQPPTFTGFIRHADNLTLRCSQYAEIAAHLEIAREHPDKRMVDQLAEQGEAASLRVGALEPGLTHRDAGIVIDVSEPQVRAIPGLGHQASSGLLDWHEGLRV